MSFSFSEKKKGSGKFTVIFSLQATRQRASEATDRNPCDRSLALFSN
jgi:hypothetical protein